MTIFVIGFHITCRRFKQRLIWVKKEHLILLFGYSQVLERMFIVIGQIPSGVAALSRKEWKDWTI